MEWKSCGRVGETTKLDRFRRILSNPVVDMEDLKKNCWKGKRSAKSLFDCADISVGIPGEVRSQCWKLLLGYLPANADRRDATLARKRQEYHENVNQYYSMHLSLPPPLPLFSFYITESAKTSNEAAILKQIQIDLPRTNPKMPLFQQVTVQQVLERILYIWAIRHPASVRNHE